ncbi:MAG: homoserine O-acetyltransferase, partial [Planctomycetota bacterium]
MSGASISSAAGAVRPSISLAGIPRSGTLEVATPAQPLVLERGDTLQHAELAFERFGPDDPEHIVLICHALTGDAHVTRQDPHDPAERTGWWETL